MMSFESWRPGLPLSDTERKKLEGFASYESGLLVAEVRYKNGIVLRRCNKILGVEWTVNGIKVKKWQIENNGWFKIKN